MSKARDAGGFARKFEGREVLEGLLELAGSDLAAEQVIEYFRRAHEAGESSSDVIPTLFDEEPHFPDPSLAKRLFGNLLGLWDLVAQNAPIRLDAAPPREKRPKPTPPPHFGHEGPDASFIDAALQYVQSVPRERHRLNDAFENRQDVLLSRLDESGLSDDGYAQARHLLYELFAILELGWPPGVRAVRSEELETAEASQVPRPLLAYAEQALSSGPESALVREWVMRGLAALWSARREVR